MKPENIHGETCIVKMPDAHSTYMHTVYNHSCIHYTYNQQNICRTSVKLMWATITNNGEENRSSQGFSNNAAIG